MSVTVLGVISSTACAIVFIHAVCQAARVKHRVMDVNLWCWVALSGSSLYASAYSLMEQPATPEIFFNVAVAMICCRVAWKIWRKEICSHG